MTDQTYQEQLAEILAGCTSYYNRESEYEGVEYTIEEAQATINALNAEMIGEDEEIVDWNRVKQSLIAGYGLGDQEGRNSFRADLRQRFGVEK